MQMGYSMEDIICVSHLKKYFQKTKAVDDISFRVKKGQLYLLEYQQPFKRNVMLTA